MDRRIVGLSILIFFVCIIPLSYVHELGHSFICMMEGYGFDIELGIDGGRMICFGEVQDAVLWGMIMGLFAFLMFIGLATRYAKKEVSAC